MMLRRLTGQMGAGRVLRRVTNEGLVATVRIVRVRGGLLLLLLLQQLLLLLLQLLLLLLLLLSHVVVGVCVFAAVCIAEQTLLLWRCSITERHHRLLSESRMFGKGGVDESAHPALRRRHRLRGAR